MQLNIDYTICNTHKNIVEKQINVIKLSI